MVRPLTSFQAPDVVVDVAGEIDLKVVAPVGPRGPEGPPGTTLRYGDGPPNSTVGNDGDFYFDTDGSDLYGPKAAGSWPSTGVSLIGPAGPAGADGEDGDSIVGPAGADGEDGADGKTVLSGSGAPASGTGSNGDFYVDTTSWVIYGPKASGSWPSGVSIVGPAGATGSPGTAGKTVLSGSGAPSGGTGSNGDFYVDTTSWVIYGPKASGSWPSGVSLVGPTGSPGSAGAAGAAGTDGKTLLNGTTAPGSGVGSAGDFYLNTATNTLYGPKDASTGWPAGVSLVGPQGPTGPAGAPGTSDTTWQFTWDSGTNYVVKDVTVRLGSQYVSKTSNINKPPESNPSDWELALSKGDTGATGAPGAAGADGKTILNGTSAPSNGIGTNGDFYLNTATSDLYGPKASGTWPSPVSLKGIQGVAGKTILSGSGAPSSGIGSDGDFYLDTTTSTLYGPKASGTWPSGVALVGPTGATGAPGADGKTILSGTSAPSSGTGSNGDFYVDVAASVFYGPKASGIWPSGVSLIGPTGQTGAAGANGKTVLSGTSAPTSGQGVDGDFFIDRTAWAIYGPKAAGAWGTPRSLIGPPGSPGAQGPPGDPTTVPDGAIPQAKVTNLVSGLASKYAKPPTGIPKTDLASAVQTSLDKADTALQTAPVTSVNGGTGAVRIFTSEPGAFFDDPSFTPGDPAVQVPVVKTYWGVKTAKYMCPVGSELVAFDIPYYEEDGVPVVGEEATFEPTTKSIARVIDPGDSESEEPESSADEVTVVPGVTEDELSAAFGEERLFVPATALYPNAGSPSLSFVNSGQVRPPVYLLDPTTNEALAGWVTLPGHWTRFRALVIYTTLASVTVTSADKVVFQLRYNTRLSYRAEVIDDELDEVVRLPRMGGASARYSITRLTVGWNIAVTPASGDSNTTIPAVPGSPIAFRLVRQATDTLDTFAQDVGVLGVMFVRDELPDPPPPLYTTDSSNSWWTLPRTAVIDGKHVAGGSSQTGEILLNIYEKTPTTSERRVIAQSNYQDDHQTPSILTGLGKPPIVFWNYHGHDNFVRYRKSTINDAISDELGPEKSIGFTANAAYQQVFATPTGEIVLFSRIGNTAWQVTWSKDWGETWSTPRQWIDFGSGNQGYMISTLLADGNTLRVAAYGHPTIGTFHNIVYMTLDLTTGDVKNRNGTIIGNFRTGAVISASTPWEVVRTQPGGTGTRLFDVSNAANPEILLASWTNDTDSVYKYLYWTGSAWSEKTIVAAGKVFGAPPSTHYLGGAHFQPGNSTPATVYVAREASGLWYIERYVSTDGGDNWTVTSLAQSSELPDAGLNMSRLARPFPFPAGSEHTLVYGRIWYYGAHGDGYMDFQEDQVVLGASTGGGSD
jgi:hypothetical protein